MPATNQLAQLHERMFQAEARISGMFPWPQGQPCDGLMELFENVEEDRLPTKIQALFPTFPPAEVDGLFEMNSEAFEEFFAHSYRHGVIGWIGVVDVPVFKPVGKGDACSFSWGHYRQKVLFAATAEGLLKQACDHAESQWKAATLSFEGEPTR